MTREQKHTRIRVLSDLHLNNKGWQAPSVPADIVILAGDISNGAAGLHWARQAFQDTPIVYVSGNQELYGHNVDQLLPEMRTLARQLGIHFLEQDIASFNGLRILGTTLWTDFDLFGQSARWLSLNRHRRDAPPDRKDIRTQYGVVTPLLKLRWHDTAVAWLRNELQKNFDGQTVVVTHHVPTIRGLPDRYIDDLSSAAFASNLDWMLPFADLWVCGHTHTAADFQAGRCRVVINPRGRTLSGNNGFDPELVIRV
ncbi:MAG: Calcineurin-like phosphoesterase superfamily domain protein [Burkholderiaceae bacterium]|nr:Calcineurin-like phosphoesterase superfamily domain protein [Burkholderiaceae bacterium]